MKNQKWMVIALTGIFLVLISGSSNAATKSAREITLNITASPTIVDYNGSSTLIWEATGAISCLASGDWSGRKGLSGAVTLTNLIRNSSYTLRCANLKGEISKTATVKVNSQAPSGPTISKRIQAAIDTSKNTDPASSCGAINQNITGSNNGFYWEIGDANGIISDVTTGLKASGSVQPASATKINYTRDMAMPIASATKMLYGAYVVESKAVSSAIGTLVIPPAYVPFLNFTSGYTNFKDKCPARDVKTVLECLDLVVQENPSIHNGTINPADVGYFFYGGGHMEVLEGGTDSALLGLMNGANHTATDISKEISAVFTAKGVAVPIRFSSVLLAGGANMSASNYAEFLKGIVKKNSPLMINYFLNPSANDPYAICTNTKDPKCINNLGKPLSHRTPVPPTESWHYGLGHWIEDDPIVGDGAYSSTGAFGFYPWIDASKTYYGILARLDTEMNLEEGRAGYNSVVCGRQIRKAFMTGEVQK